MKRWIASAALVGVVALGGCSKQTAEGNATAVEASTNTDETAGADTLATLNEADAGLLNASGNASGDVGASANNTSG